MILRSGDGLTGIAAAPRNALPSALSLQQNYPNPFDRSTAIRFTLNRDAYTTVAVYDLLGQLLETVREGLLKAGAHEVEFEGGRHKAGLYLYRVQVGGEGASGRMLLAR